MKFFKRYTKVWGILIAVLISLLIFIFRDKLAGLQTYGFFGLFLLNIVGSATLFLPTPLFLSAFVAGSIYNPILVAIVASAGSAIGELTGYLAGYGAEDILEKDIKVQKIKGWMKKRGFLTLFLLAAIPNPVFDMAGFVAGATDVSVKKYLIAVWLGKLVKFSVISYAGASSLALFGV
ncbi:MAG: VTT domain-containing protein [Candidatus Woesebacteria bacterium]|nr:MAG: VTT domain-containing protein [Candidatus Woesebacteria bacterium]